MTITLGLVGVGRWGPNLLRNFHNHRTSVVRVIADRDEQRLAQVAALYPDIRAATDIDAVLEADDVVGVVIATPTATHYELVKRALSAGKHVMVEKPLTDDVAQAEELTALAEARGAVLLVGHVFLYNPAVERVKEYLAAGTLGRPYYIAMARTNLGPIRTDVNASWDLASHDISIADYWLGASPTEVSATGGKWINDGIADAVFVTLHYPDDVLVNLEASWLNPRKVRDVTIVAEHKMLTLDDTNPQEPIRIYDKGVTDTKVREGVVDTLGGFRSLVHEGDIVIPRVSLGEPLKSECDHFLECIASGVTPRSGPRLATDVVRVLAAIDRSMELGGARVTVAAARG